jgi:methionine transaminase
VVVSSPENPTGAIYSSADFDAILTAASDRHIPLVVDQCFAKVTPFQDVPLLFDGHVLSRDHDWSVVWDTGKMFDMDDDKLGFAFCSPSLSDRVRSRIEVLQCTIPKRLLMLFRLVLRDARQANYVREFGALIRRNFETVREICAGSAASVAHPTAGSFVLLDVSKTCAHIEGVELARLLLERTGVGVVSADRFFHRSGTGRKLLRLALARDPEIVEEGATRIIAALNDLTSER